MNVKSVCKDVAIPTIVLTRRIPRRPPADVEIGAAIPRAQVVTVEADPVIPGRWLPQETEAVEAFLGIDSVPMPARVPKLPADGAAARLTAREREVLALLVAGRSNREIAGDLVLSERTVARHIANMYEKLSVHGRAEITAYALRHNLA